MFSIKNPHFLNKSAIGSIVTYFCGFVGNFIGFWTIVGVRREVLLSISFSYLERIFVPQARHIPRAEFF